MGVLMGFITNFVAAFTKRGGTDEQLHELLVGKKSEEFIVKVVDLAMEMGKKAKLTFPIFKTITLGVYQSVSAYREALEKAGFRIGAWASDVLNGIQVSQSQVQLDLVVLSVADLGFKEAAQPDQIYARAKELGLELCPAEVGPALRLAYPDQPQGECLRIAMELISGSCGFLGIFEVGYDINGWWLSSDYDNLAGPWFLGGRFVFVLPRK